MWKRLRRVLLVLLLAAAAALFVETYRELPLLAWPREVLDSLVELEQQFVVFRQRHARMAERVIGRRAGTGGTAGVAYGLHFTRRSPRAGRIATASLAAAVLVHTFVIGMQTMEVGHVPYANPSRAISTFVWLLALSYLYLEVTTAEPYGET